jgi:hypothetical protein
LRERHGTERAAKLLGSGEAISGVRAQGEVDQGTEGSWDVGVHFLRRGEFVAPWRRRLAGDKLM